MAADVDVDEGVAAQLVVGAAADAAAAAVSGGAQDGEGRSFAAVLIQLGGQHTFQLVLGHVRMDLAQSVVKGLLGEETGLAHHFLLIGGLVHAQVDEQVAAVDDLAAGLNGGTDLLIEGVRGDVVVGQAQTFDALAAGDLAKQLTQAVIRHADPVAHRPAGVAEGGAAADGVHAKGSLAAKLGGLAADQHQWRAGTAHQNAAHLKQRPVFTQVEDVFIHAGIGIAEDCV